MAEPSRGRVDALGPYRFLVKIGEGGMGEVYRALDTTLNREVAVKILLQSVVDDPERLARFKREAKTLASLNHPNIAQIHGFEQAGDTSGLVMEFVAGADLSQLIARGPVPIEDAVAIGRQVAAALAAAHDRGIIHRDLKPANIKVRDDGTVKVLDFGLAKAMARGSSDTVEPDGESAATISSSGISVHGSIVGTAAYMSPEQARGGAVDQRSDIWSFGCVLFEMLAGARAFGGRDMATIMSNVLTASPDWAALPSGTPRSIRRLLRRCLQKDRAKRLQHIADAALELDDAFADTGDEEGVAVHTARARRVSWRSRTLAYPTIALFAVGAALYAFTLSRRTPDARELRLEVSTPATENISSLAISPDGRTVAFVALDSGRARLWLRALDSASARPLAGTDGASLPFWSPDGRALAFFADDG